MIQKTFITLSLLTLLIVQGCATPPYRPPTPYHKKDTPQPSVDSKETLPDSAEPARPPARQPVSPIVRDISQQASQLMQNGNLDSAAQTLERGLRIAPKDAALWSQLAAVRLQQLRYGQAISLAAKSNSLAGGDTILIRRNQHIIETAQRARNTKKYK